MNAILAHSQAARPHVRDFAWILPAALFALVLAGALLGLLTGAASPGIVIGADGLAGTFLMVP